jgi:23S rRNA (cytidine1920-2'-O)/16S rRNA (cytidine1409-2'-O)-methyltransferase
MPEGIQIATIDAAFISLELLLPVVRGWLVAGGQLVALIKPQFEAGRGFIGKQGVVRDPAVHRRVVEKILSAASSTGLTPQGVLRSPLIGPKGNAEFLLWCIMDGPACPFGEQLLALFGAPAA